MQWDSSWPSCVEGKERTLLLLFFERRFGIPLDSFDRYLLMARGRTCWIFSGAPLHLEIPFMQVETVGIPLLRILNKGLKPTTAALQLFGKRATINKVALDREGLVELLSKGETTAPETDAETGYVILTHGSDGRIIGCGLLQQKGRLVSQIPKAIVRDIRSDLSIP